MKIDTICEDSHGNTAIVLVDLDYIDPYDYSALKIWCENELHHHMNKFDVFDFKISNYNDLVEAAKLIRCDSDTGVVYFNTNQLSYIEDSNGYDEIAINGELLIP